MTRLLLFATILMSLCFVTFVIGFAITELFISLKKFFSKLFFAFALSFLLKSAYVCGQDFWLNSITPCAFFSFNPWSNVCFRVLCVWHSLSCYTNYTTVSFRKERQVSAQLLSSLWYLTSTSSIYLMPLSSS